MSVLTRYLPAPPPPPPLLLARGDVFFVRRVELVSTEPSGPQITLALEGMAPFPPEQLYFGHVRAADGASALIFAAFRRRFSAEETAAWAGAERVLPDFATLLVARPGVAGGLVDGALVHLGEGRVTALAWRAGLELPVVVLVRAGGEAEAAGVIAELWERSGLPEGAELRRLDGTPVLAVQADGALAVRVGEAGLGVLPVDWPATADIRDPGFLEARRNAAVRDLWLWRGLLGAAALLVFAATLDLGGAFLSILGGARERKIVAQAETVRQTETSQELATRIAELSERRLMPFEMMDLINPARPDTVVFQRAITRGLLKLEVEAQAQNAEDVGNYTNALKQQPGISSVVARDIRAREGVTSFILEVEFTVEALRNGGVS
jgi:hypothetical protein